VFAQVEPISLPEFQMPSRPLCSLTILAASCVLTSPLFAQLQTPPRPPAPVFSGQDIAAVNATIDRLGFDFVTVGAPGNRSWIRSEWAISGNVIGSTPNHIDDRGRVDYSYRIMRTEVVQTQYVDFLRGFEPFWRSIENIPNSVETGSPTDNSVTGRGISIFGSFDVNHAFDNSAMTISWRNAARYANWLHNGAPTDAADLSWDTFHTGAYTFTDESFTSGVRGTPITRNADARFWLPSLDELLKATYYNPDRYGEEEEGYWLYPHSSNDEPVPMVGQPGGDYGAPDINGDGQISGWEALAVGQYPGTVSPWGLLDVLGTENEWVESPYAIRQLSDGTFILALSDRVTVGSNPSFGAIDAWSSDLEWFGTSTFRLATIVPSSGSVVVLGLGVALAARRRR
jgi:formylglycine-generating enzyme required for sulfatase activity